MLISVQYSFMAATESWTEEYHRLVGLVVLVAVARRAVRHARVQDCNTPIQCDEDAGAFCDAVFRKAATLLRADALHPLIHVAGAWRGHEQRRRDAALAERDRLLAETSASA